MNRELTDWTGPHGLPRFDLISDDDFAPAMQAALNDADTAIEAIAARALDADVLARIARDAHHGTIGASWSALAAASACPVAVEQASLDEALEMAASLAATSFCNCPPTRLAKRM